MVLRGIEFAALRCVALRGERHVSNLAPLATAIESTTNTTSFKVVVVASDVLNAHVVRLGSSEPGDSLSIKPLALAFVLLGDGVVDTCTVHLVVLELADVVITVGEKARSRATLLAVDPLALVLGAVGVLHGALAMHRVVLERTGIDLLVLEEAVATMAMESTVEELASVLAGLGLELTLADFLSIDESTLVGDGATLPLLLTNTVLLVVFPGTFIERLLDSAVVDTRTVGLAVLPAAPVDRAISLLHLTAAIELVIGELATILGAISELDDSKAIGSLTVLCPLALILTTVADVGEVVVPGELVGCALML